jgi:hypothetical protein
MDWVLLLIVSPFAALAWWAGFFATKRMRLEKNRLREEAAAQHRRETIESEQREAADA